MTARVFATIGIVSVRQHQSRSQPAFPVDGGRPRWPGSRNVAMRGPGRSPGPSARAETVRARSADVHRQTWPVVRFTVTSATQPTSASAPERACCWSAGCVRQLRGLGTSSAGGTSACPTIRLRRGDEAVGAVTRCARSALSFVAVCGGPGGSRQVAELRRGYRSRPDHLQVFSPPSAALPQGRVERAVGRLPYSVSDTAAVVVDGVGHLIGSRQADRSPR